MYEDNPYLEDPQEFQHFREHISSLMNYFEDNVQTYTPPTEQEVPSALPHSILNKRCERLRQLVELNHQFLLQLIPKEEPSPLESTNNNKSKVKSTLRQFYREWCQESQQRLKYNQILQLFKKYKQKGKVLIPGCGLGRIVLEFVKAGYATEGNEVSYFMLFGSQFILNNVKQKNSIEIAPFIHNLSGYRSSIHPLRTVRIPDLISFQEVDQNCQFSMRAGQFVESYGEEPNVWDGVVTCFFIDTATNIFNYVDTIHSILKQDGVWVNYGPLLYHFKQNLEQQSIEISWETLREYILTKFQIKEECLEQTTYCHDPKSINKLVYRCIKFAATKKKQVNPTD